MSGETDEAPRKDELTESRRLHQAVARYRVVIKKRDAKDREMGSGLRWSEAEDLSKRTTEQLEREEPELQGRMCRSIACIEMTNSEAVAKILGYGPNFCSVRAAAAVAALGMLD